MQIDESKDRILTKKEEELFGNSLRKALIHGRPNPGRIGCPDRKIIRDLAFHKRMGDTATFERVADHMFDCSPCVQDVLVYAEEYQQERKKRRWRLAVLGLAAAVLLSISIWQFDRLLPKQEVAAKSPILPARPPAESVVADAGNRRNDQPLLARFQAVAIELPTSWRGAVSNGNEIVLPRGLLQLEVRLPIGSSEGTYKLRISDGAGKVRTTSQGIARTNSGTVTSLDLPLDTSAFASGKYTLGVLEPGLDEWVEYSIRVK